MHGVVNKFKAFIDNPTNLQNRSKLIYDTLVSQTQSYISDLNNGEQVAAGYAMGVIDLKNLTIIAGLRVENTSTESNNRTIATVSGKLTPGNTRTTNSYANLLPSIQLKYNITKNLLARASGRIHWEGRIILNFQVLPSLPMLLLPIPVFIPAL